MNAASLELCKELYELSGWDDADNWYHKRQKPGDEALCIVCLRDMGFEETLPAYDCGYLLRRMSWSIKRSVDKAAVEISTLDTRYYAIYNDLGVYFESEDADTPEDALCKLAIELFKQGLLQREQA